MPKKTARQLDREIAEHLAAAEATAADYVGKARARAMAKAGYFEREYARHKKAGTLPARQAPASMYEVTNLGGAVLHGGLSDVDHASRVAEAAEPADLVLQIWKVDGATGRRRLVAERVTWNAAEQRRNWKTFPPL